MQLVRKAVLEAYMETPPPGYAPISLDMLRRVDEEICYQLTRLCKNGVRPDSNGFLPIDTKMNEAIDSKRVRLLLQPLPAASGRGSSSDDAAPPFRDTKRARNAEQAQRAEQAKQAKLAVNVTKAFGEPRKGGKGKGKGG